MKRKDVTRERTRAQGSGWNSQVVAIRAERVRRRERPAAKGSMWFVVLIVVLCLAAFAAPFVVKLSGVADLRFSASSRTSIGVLGAASS